MNIGKVMAFSESIGINAWLGYVPADETLPAVAITHITDGYQRIIDGKKSGETESWRFIVVGESSIDVSQVADMIRATDNTKNDAIGYSKIYVINDELITGDEGDTLIRIVIDLQFAKG